MLGDRYKLNNILRIPNHRMGKIFDWRANMNPKKNRARGKRHERRTAEDFGGIRTGILGREDVITETFSIECKSRNRFVGQKWWLQAYRNAMRHENPRIPLVVVHLTGKSFNEDFIIIRKDHFMQLFEDKIKKDNEDDE